MVVTAQQVSDQEIGTYGESKQIIEEILGFIGEGETPGQVGKPETLIAEDSEIVEEGHPLKILRITRDATIFRNFIMINVCKVISKRKFLE